MTLRYFRSGEVDTPEEVALAFRKVIDELNLLTKRMDINDEYNDEVEEYNDGLIEKKGAKNA